MKQAFNFALGVIAACAIGFADAQTVLSQGVSRVVRICGVVAVGDGFTPVTTLTLSGADEAEALRDNTATLDISGATWAAITGADGCYSLTLDTTATNTVGELVVAINDDSLVLPIWRVFQVVEPALFDAFYANAATAMIPANAIQVGGQTASAAGTVTFPGAVASTTNITAGTITTVTNLTNAPTSGDLTATMKASVNTEADTALTDYDPPTNAELNTAIALVQSMIGQRTAITVTDQNTIVLTDGADRDNAYNGHGLLLLDVTNAGEWDLLALADGSYTGSSKSLELPRNAAYTIATGDIAVLLPAFLTTGVAVTAAAATTIVDEFETQSAADPTGFRVNVMEVGGTAQTAGDVIGDTNDLQTRVPAALVGGRIDATVDGTGMEAGAVTAVQSGLATAAALAIVDQNVDDLEAGLEMLMLADSALMNCTVNTAFFAGSSTTVACILTDKDGGAVTQASNDLEGLLFVVMSGAEIREQRFITDSTWDAANSELRLTLGRALPGTLADAVTAIIR
jgi:hypothetical protein